MTAISTTATMFIHLYFDPSVHDPGSNASPIRQRRKIGIRNARYSPITATETIARNATGTPPMLFRAGSVMMMPIAVTNMTALAGIRVVGLTFASQAEPGMAPSRLKAKVIREALVRQAVVQNS